MCNLQTHLFSNFSSHCFMVLCSFFLLFFACTTTETNQNGDQLARRMTGGEDTKDRGLFYARVFSFNEERLVKTCAGAFISFDLVITALNCVLRTGVYGETYKTVVQRSDFSSRNKDKVKGKIQGKKNNFVVNVSHIHKSPQYEQYSNRLGRIPKQLIYDVALLQIEKPFPDSSQKNAFKPLRHCEDDTRGNFGEIKMIGLKKEEDQNFTIKTYFHGIEKNFDLYSGVLNEASIYKVHPFSFFKGREDLIEAWGRRDNRILVVSKKETVRMDNHFAEIGSPAVQFDHNNSPICLYGVLSGFITGQEMLSSLPGDLPRNAVALQVSWFYSNWIKEHTKKSNERKKKNDGLMKKLMPWFKVKQ